MPEAKHDADTLDGTIDEVLYVSADTDFACLVVRRDGGLRARACGALPHPIAGERITLAGEWSRHHPYARVFTFTQARVRPPAGRAAQRDYIADALECPDTTAEQLIQQFGESLLSVLDADPERLTEVAGLSINDAQRFHRTWLQRKTSHKLTAALESLGLDASLIGDYRRNIGDSDDPDQQIRRNPYLLALYLPEQVGFEQADTIARQLGVLQPVARASALIVDTLRRERERGHTYCERDALLKQVRRRGQLNDDDHSATNALQGLIRRELVVYERERCHLASAYHNERTIARRVPALAHGEWDVETVIARERLARLFADAFGGRRPTELFLDAAEAVLARKVLALDAPGAETSARFTQGLLVLTDSLAAATRVVAVTAGTRERLRRITGAEVYSPEALVGARRSGPPRHHANNPLPLDMLVVHDANLLSQTRLAELLDALGDKAGLVLVGDPYGPPPLHGDGAPYQELIASEAVSVLRIPLARADGVKAISELRQALRSKTPVPIPQHPNRAAAIWHIPVTDAQINATATALYRDILPLTGVDRLRDTLVLTLRPRSKLNALNDTLRVLLNPDQLTVISHAGVLLRIGDPVYARDDLETFDLPAHRRCRVIDLQAGGTVVLDDGGRRLALGPAAAASLEPDYARVPTRHPGYTAHTVMLACGEPYTRYLDSGTVALAATLARERLILLGDTEAFRQIASTPPSPRRSALAESMTLKATPSDVTTHEHYA